VDEILSWNNGTWKWLNFIRSKCKDGITPNSNIYQQWKYTHGGWLGVLRRTTQRLSTQVDRHERLDSTDQQSGHQNMDQHSDAQRPKGTSSLKGVQKQ